MTALTHQITSRTLVTTAFLAAAIAGLIVALLLGTLATSGRSPSGHRAQSTSVSQPARGRDFPPPGCLVCYR